MRPMDTSWSDRIVEARTAAGLTQTQLGDAVGAAQTTINGWEHATAEPSLAAFQRIAKATDRPVEWLAFGIEAERPVKRGRKTRDTYLIALSRLSETLARQHTETMAAIGDLVGRVERLERRVPKE